jgi:hypothetical protein
LLCLYCHDNEHQRYQVGGGVNESPSSREPDRFFTPFANLSNLVKRKPPD